MREPHGGAQTLSGNVSDAEYGVEPRVKGSQEIARSVPHGKGLTGNIAQPLLDVGRFKEPKL